MKELMDLYWIFFRMGAFTFGGGYAMLPIMQEEIVNKRQWATDTEIIDYYALGQVVPGIIAINTATLIGHRRRGNWGGLFSTLGMISPSIIIITIIAAFFHRFQEYQVVQQAFGGIRVVVVALIAHAVIKMWKQSVKNKVGFVLFLISFLVIILSNISPIVVIIASALAGLVLLQNKEGVAPK
ncbi:chromate transporter [Alkaliphilus serpentinus]|uniref:Chromate transporter n=1 Tax=Alkaliphilus serpentinus TaxID=1482731 RepID=A0A833HPL8_9FIRM|nr:chromate transporter [Alkaliphilus serpentinus]KAB3531080.1 chromate transporter [Alkaliphilus serpentinus]